MNNELRMTNEELAREAGVMGGCGRSGESVMFSAAVVTFAVAGYAVVVVALAALCFAAWLMA